MIKKISILFIILGLISLGLKAQVVPAPTQSFLSLKLVKKVTISDAQLNATFNPMAVLSPSDTLLVKLSMLVDTNAVDVIHIKLGTTMGGNDLLAQSFNYDASNLTAPQTYERRDNRIKIGLGKYLNHGVFYCEIKLEDAQGNFSTITNCQSDQ